MMESVSFQGLRQRHINTTSDSTSTELTSEMPTTVIENSPLHHDLNDEFMSDEITSTPFQTRAGSPSRGDIMPHTVAQATKFMSDLHAIVETGTESNTAAIGSDARTASKPNEKSPGSAAAVPVPAPAASGIKKTIIYVLVVWVCLMMLASPLLFHFCDVRLNPNDHSQATRQCVC